MQPDDALNSDRRSVLKAAGALGAFFGSSGVASATDDGDSSSNASELLVGVSPSVPNAESIVSSALGNGEVVHTNEALHYTTIEFPADTPEEAKAQVEGTLEGIDMIEYVEENATLAAIETPNDPYYSQQHAPQQIDCAGAWERTFGDSDVVISVVDQGVQYDHENLEANVDDRIGEVFAGRGSDPYPVNSNETHGTIVAGIAGGETNNATGHAGISNCSILSARALGSDGSGSLSDIADAIQWSADQGVDVINLSLGASSGWHTLANACSYAVDQGCLLVAAAGNDGGSVSYPAVYDSVLAVSALTSNNRLASFSNRGSEIDLAAPGSSVLSTTLNDGYTRASGTSMAAPVVAGVAGLVRSRYPDLSSEELREHLQETAADVGLSARAQGHGRIDADAAVNTVPDGHEPDDGDDEDGREDEDDSNDDEQDEEDEERDDEDDVPEDLLAVVTEPDARFAEYEFTAEGPVEFTEAPYESPSGGTIEGGTYTGVDTIDEDDGTWHASGSTGGGQGDAFIVDGPITAIELDQPDASWLELGGERLSPEEVIEETGGNDENGDDDDDEEDHDGVADDLLAVVTEPDARFAEYEFTAEGLVEFTEAPYESPSGGTIEGGTYSGVDTIDEDDGTWYASGSTGGGQGDAFTVDGPITAIELDQPDASWLELGGERLSPEEIIEETGGNDENGDDDEDEEPEQPGTPADLEVVAVDETSIEVAWSSDPHADSYSVSVDGDLETETTESTATIEELDPGTTYEIGVSAVGPGGEETDTATLEATTDESTGGVCGSENETTTVQGSLTSGWWGYSDRWTYSFKTANPCEVTISVDGPANADFDLYVSLDGNLPTRSRYDASSTGGGADEEVTVELSSDDSVGVLVYAEAGRGTYTLTFEEQGR